MIIWSGGLKSPQRTPSGAILGAALIILAMERRAPHHEVWRPGPKVWGLDLVHSLVSNAALPTVLSPLLIGLLHFGTTSAVPTGWDLWPSDIHFGWQLAGALLIAEFGTYWSHRAYHEIRIIWPIHAVHHSVEHMHTLAAGRTHPINVTTALIVGTAPLLALGAPVEIIGLVNVFTGVNGLLQHANMDMRMGWLSWILAGPDLHHYHHSQILSESNSNYGSNLIVWDIVFGTRHAPAGERPSRAVGLNEASLPESFWLHLALPFTYRNSTRRFSRQRKESIRILEAEEPLESWARTPHPHLDTGPSKAPHG